MRLSLAIAALLVLTGTALPALAAAPTGHYFYSHGAAGIQRGYRNGYDAYATAPAPARRANRQVRSGWGHCVSRSAGRGNYSAYPSWDVC